MVYSIMNDGFDNERIKYSNSEFLTEQKARIKIVKPFFINNQNGSFHKVRILDSRMLIGNNYLCNIINFIYRSIHGYLDFSSNQHYSVIKFDIEINDCAHFLFFFAILFFYHKSKTLLFRLLFLPLFCCLMLFISILINFMN